MRLLFSVRESEREGAAGAVALEGERGAVRFGDPAADREAEAGAGAIAGGVRAVETVEDAGAMLVADAGAGVAHEDGRPAAAVPAHGDTSRRRVLDGVVGEVEQELQEQV